MSQMVTNEFFGGLKRKATSAEQIDINEPKHKRRKTIFETTDKKEEEAFNVGEILEELDVANDSPLEPSIFSGLPSEIIEHHIIVHFPIEWMYISKHYHILAMRNIDRDPRLHWDTFSLDRAALVDNLPIVLKHLERDYFDYATRRNVFIQAAGNGCGKIVMHFLTNDSLLPEDDSLYFNTKSDVISSALIGAVRNNDKEMVLLLVENKLADPKCAANNSHLKVALDRKKKDIAEILIEKGFYSTNDLITVIHSQLHHNDPDLLDLLFQRIDFTLSHQEKLLLLDEAIRLSAINIIDYLLRGILASMTQFDDPFIIKAIDNNDLVSIERLLLDKRFHVTAETLNRAIYRDSEPIMWMLLTDPRLQTFSDSHYILRKALLYASPTILCSILSDPTVDVASCLDADLIEHTIQQNMDSTRHVIIILLSDFRINYHYYASLSLCTALQNNCPDTIMNDDRFIVIDDRHLQIAIDCAIKKFKTHLVQRLENIKHVARLSPTEPWTPN